LHNVLVELHYLKHAHTQEISYINSFMFETLFKLSSLIGFQVEFDTHVYVLVLL
ncbi:hypothetical protein ACJX0J_026436, partial [Zea mays]